MTDLEIVVIGDACTDDSEQVLRSLEDPRVRWKNLPRNFGEQSVPSNCGIDMSRGRFIFFLNQDDLWRPTHVRSCLNVMEGEAADVVWSPYLVVPEGCRVENLADVRPKLRGLTRGFPAYHHGGFIPASCTAWRADTLRAIGGWKTAAEVSVSPSQDLLWRAHRHGAKLTGKPDPTVVVLWSGGRPTSYRSDYVPNDNVAWLQAIRSNPSGVDEAMMGALADCICEISMDSTVRNAVRWRIADVVAWIIASTGRHPQSVRTYIKYRKAGGFINAVRAASGLARVEFRRGDGNQR